MGLSLKFPKAAIMRKVIREGRDSLHCLESSVVGPTAVAISNRSVSELKGALDYLMRADQQSQVSVIAGKFEEYAFTREGMDDLIRHQEPYESVSMDLVGVMERPAQMMVNEMQRAPMALAMALQQYQETMTKTD